MNFYLITAFYVAVGGLGIGIFLWGKADGNSGFDRMYRLVCMRCPRLLKKALEKCCGKRAPAALDAAWDYVCYQSNPMVQVFYLAVVVGGYLTFVASGYTHIPNRMLGYQHKFVGFFIFSMCLVVWWKACSTDPGIVTSKNVDGLIEIYPWDNQIFASTRCTSCDLVKPARSKHCSLCKVCVAKFDHHCIWINNCVGVGNHKWFLMFLFWHLLICLYGCALGTTIAYELIMQKDLLRAVFIDPITKERHKATYMVVAQYMLATEGMLVFVGVLSCVMGAVLFGFFLWHLNLVRTGTTTNELSKWNYVKWYIKQEEDGKEKVKQLRNIYNAGCFANFREVFVPLNVHQLPRQIGQDTKENGQKDQAPAGKRGRSNGKVKKG